MFGWMASDDPSAGNNTSLVVICRIHDLPDPTGALPSSDLLYEYFCSIRVLKKGFSDGGRCV